jgi:RND family efflux transporter MFP subunit
VISTSNSRISAEVSARVLSFPAAVGETVNKGDIIVRLEKEDYQLALEREQAKLEALQTRIDLADYELKRAQSLSQKQAVSEQLLKQRETDLNTLVADEKGQRAALALAKRNLDKTDIRALFPAIVTEHISQVGELAAPGTPLLQLLNSESLEVSAKIQAQQADAIRQAKTLLFTQAGKHYPLHLRTITPAIDSTTRTREVRLTFTEKPALPGSAGELSWKQVTASLPADLVVKRNGQLGVFIVNNENGNQARFVPLPGAEEGRPAETDLPPTTAVITEGRFRLQDGGAIIQQNEDGGSDH